MKWICNADYIVIAVSIAMSVVRLFENISFLTFCKELNRVKNNGSSYKLDKYYLVYVLQLRKFFFFFFAIPNYARVFLVRMSTTIVVVVCMLR